MFLKVCLARKEIPSLESRGTDALPLLPNMVVVARAKKAFPIGFAFALFSYHQHDAIECAYQPNAFIQIKLTNSNILTLQTNQNIHSQTQLKLNNLTLYRTKKNKRNNQSDIKVIKTISTKTPVYQCNHYNPNQQYYHYIFYQCIR